MPKLHSERCEDEDDASRMTENIMRRLGYLNVQRGSNVYDVNSRISPSDLLYIARNAERIARWARKEASGK